jgi:uncharacterized protein
MTARLGLLPALLALLFAFASAAALAAAPNYPALTGRIVDQANILSVGTRTALHDKLKDLARTTGDELVVATVSSLEGREIKPYATGLFNLWRLGDAKKNNGVLLLVAPSEHKARIEVGRGLEATLTNAKAKAILAKVVLPKFKAGDFDGGVAEGVDAIVAILATDSAPAAPEAKP